MYGKVDGNDAKSLAGLSGYAFSKVLVDSEGNRHVPHYKAIDIASDNRIAPGSNRITEHSFQIDPECSSGQVRAQLLYRPIPLSLAVPRGWEAKDYVIASSVESWQ